MTALKLIEQAASLIGTVGIEDSRIAEIAKNAVNRIYCEICFNEGIEFSEIKSINDEIKVSERLFYEVMPYGVASLIAGAVGDGENQNYYGRIYNLKRKKHKESYVEDVIPVV